MPFVPLGTSGLGHFDIKRPCARCFFDHTNTRNSVVFELTRKTAGRNEQARAREKQEPAISEEVMTRARGGGAAIFSSRSPSG